MSISKVNADQAKVVTLVRADVAAVAALERQCFSSPWDEKLYTAALLQPYFRLWGIKPAGRLAGYVSVYHLGAEMEIINIAVDPALRRQGAGTRLLAHARAEGLAAGVERIILEVRRSNAAAIALYSSQGFSFAGVRRNYYPDTGEDGLIYELRLLDAPREDA